MAGLVPLRTDNIAKNQVGGNEEKLVNEAASEARRLGLRPLHPRACGERMPATAKPATVVGSSPRMRGTATQAVIGGMRKRFIPAHAGNRTLVPRDPSLFAVHPRACGEQSTFSRSTHSLVGSSPRMRGTESRMERKTRQ